MTVDQSIRCGRADRTGTAPALTRTPVYLQDGRACWDAHPAPC